MKHISENKIESFAIEQLQSLGWEYIHILALSSRTAQMENMLCSKLMSGEVRVQS